MKIIKYILNVPWSLVGVVLGVISAPKRIRFAKDAVVINVHSFWWTKNTYMRGSRAMVQGNIVLLGPSLEKNDFEHEMVHIEQFMRWPFVFEFMSLIEIMRARGSSPRNKYEDEAYRRSGSVYKGKGTPITFSNSHE